jgi:phosphoglycerol transferase MdoB-like AlkP superfamily enzyme
LLGHLSLAFLLNFARIMDKLKIILSFIKLYIFWLAFFAIARALYLLYNLNFLGREGVTFLESLSSFYHGFGLDMAVGAYFMIFPFFVFFFQSLIKKQFLNQIIKYYVLLIIIAFSLLTIAELGIYKEWGTKLHYKALMYMMHPSEIYNSAETSVFFLLLILLIGMIVLSFWLYRRFFYQKVLIQKRNYFFSLIYLIVFPPLLVFAMRGGLQEIPLTQSASYYSKHNILNLASMNSGFNIFVSIHENYKTDGKNPYQSFPDEQAKLIIDEIYTCPKDTTVQVLTTSRPNIVLVILESWSADLIESLGATAGITPKFHELEKEGILFTNIYASGSRSEQGMAAIFASFPAHPLSSITVQPDKHAGLPSIVKKFNDLDYFSSFYFGGQLIYGNIKSYIMYNAFDRIMEGEDFDKSFFRGKLGVHDEFVFSQMLDDLDKDSKPFFSAIFTVSTHSPFDMPMPEKKIFWGDHVNEYLNSAWYTDSCLNVFIQQAKTKDWYDSTLFIFMADHSHHSYKHNNIFRKDYHRIPLLLFGEVIKPEFRGKQIEKLGSQVDLNATILNQLGLPDKDFHWSKNLLNPYSPEFAYNAFEEGVGWVRPYGDFYYKNSADHFFYQNIPDSVDKEKLINEGKAYLQMVFQEYMDH